MKFKRHGKSSWDPRCTYLGGVLVAGIVAFALRHHCGEHTSMARSALVAVVMVGGIARYWRPRFADARPVVVLQPKRVRFSPEVECMAVPRLLEATDQKKAQLWWQQNDFDEFLKVRLEIAKAYKAAAQKMGVELNSVCSVGVHSFAGYQMMRETYPGLKDESRRGLGLGRKRSRAKNRVAYISAVSKEQRRQHELGIRDEDALARVASRFSKNDQQYAHFLAQTYYEQDRADEANEANEAKAHAEDEVPGRTAPSGTAEAPHEVRTASHTSTRSIEEDSPNRGWSFPRFTETLADSHDEIAPPSPSPRNSTHRAKGFGLSKFQLQAAGLSATGHALLKSRSPNAEDSEMSGAESGAESEAPTDMD